MNKYFKLLAWSAAGLVACLLNLWAFKGISALLLAAGIFQGFKELMKDND